MLWLLSTGTVAGRRGVSGTTMPKTTARSQRNTAIVPFIIKINSAAMPAGQDRDYDQAAYCIKAPRLLPEGPDHVNGPAITTGLGYFCRRGLQGVPQDWNKILAARLGITTATKLPPEAYWTVATVVDRLSRDDESATGRTIPEILSSRRVISRRPP